MNKYKYLIKNIFLFIISSFVPKALAFFMVPLYTRCLSTTDYGTADLLSSTVSLIMPILTLQVQDAIMKYTIQNKYKKGDILTVGIKITLIGGFILIFFSLLLSILNIISLAPIYLLYLCINYYTGAIGNIFTYFCRGIDKISVITLSSVVCSFITIISNILFLVVLQWGLVGYLLANSLGNVIRIVVLYYGASLKKYLYFSQVPIEITKDIVKFSIPMIFSALSWWVNNASDRYVLSYFCGVSVVGIYSVSSKIPTILSTLGEVIAKSFSISAIKEFDADDKDSFLGRSYSTISLGMTITCSVIMLFNVFLSNILFANDFYIAWKYIPPLLVAVLANQLSLTCENILLAIDKTNIISFTAIIGACFNTFLNIILVPSLNAYGAAIATLFGFLLTWIVRYKVLKKYVRLRNSFTKEIISYLLLFIQMILGYFGNKYLFFEFIIFLFIVVLYFRELKFYALILYRKLRDLKSFI